MSSRPDYLPTATLEMLRIRSQLLKAVRSFFDTRGYWEVETPLLSHDCAVDPHLAPFVALWHASGFVANPESAASTGVPLYLQTSPEFGMKRLIAAGAQAIYQVDRVFRNGESGRRHNPEFTMVEWYQVGDTLEDQMQVVEDLVQTIAERAQSLATFPSIARADCVGFKRTTYDAAFARQFGTGVLKLGMPEIRALGKRAGIIAPESLAADDRDGWLNLLLAEAVEPTLGCDVPEFIHDYPASQSALARIRPGNPPVAERFELYIRGIELCNGYRELTDPDELRGRIVAESQRRAAEGIAPLPVTNRLLDAMEAGLPDCAGVALGFDRLVMAVTGVETLAEVLAFPFDRA